MNEKNKKLFCSQCGNELKSDAKFCTKCGSAVPTQKDASDSVAHQNRQGAEPRYISRKPVKKRKSRWIVPFVLMLLLLLGGGAIWLLLQEEDNFLKDVLDRHIAKEWRESQESVRGKETENLKEKSGDEVSETKMAEVETAEIEAEPHPATEMIADRTTEYEPGSMTEPRKSDEPMEADSNPDMTEPQETTVGEPSSSEPETQEELIEEIRYLYYTMNETPEELAVEKTSDGRSWIYEGNQLAKFIGQEAVYQGEEKITDATIAFYYYNADEAGTSEVAPAFIFVTDNTNGDEYRMYFSDGNLVRYIGSDGVTREFEGGVYVSTGTEPEPDALYAGECYSRAVFLHEFHAKEQEYILSGSDSRYLTYDDVAYLDKYTLRLARNEIFARHGRKFETEELDRYFRQRPWYDGYLTEEEFDDSVFNDMEKKNIDLIKEAEQR